MKINSVIVLYNPDKSVIKNINSYINDIDKIYIVDNSETKNHELINKIVTISDKCIYSDNNGNQGIAYALNVGAKLAIENGADWLLTMDQDSSFEKSSLDVLIEWIKNNDISKVGIISPYHLMLDQIDIHKKENKVIDELTVMTSGNLLNLEAYKNIGKFEEKYSIDYVNHEYCLRLQSNGFYIKVHKNSILVHALGNISSKSLLGKRVAYTNHNHLRRYYITRNRLDVIKKYFFKYFVFSIKELKAIIFEWIKIILFEQNKIKKQKAILLGTFDFLRNKYGKYND
jgi:rhamnosyltransferase